MDKVTWTKELWHTFCDLCIKAIDLEMRPTTHFDKTSWKFMITSFKERIVKGAKKIWHVRIEPVLKLKYDRMYSYIVDTGEYA
ncbi:L10-interacting MYB domain-containing protein [Salix suchowensis]|nr:L10-interacting MYB domain-containing protein [Salix suchowensis]